VPNAIISYGPRTVEVTSYTFYWRYQMDKARINQILQANKSKSFVDRILNKDRYPTLDLGNGNYATHKMAWAKVGEKYYVFPTVLWDGKKLTQYDPKKAYGYVKKSNNFISFDTPEEAADFSKNYKLIWEK